MARGRRSEPVNRHWTGFSFGSAFTAVAAASSVAATLSAAQHDRETLMRTRGTLLTFLDAVNAPGALMQVAVGFALVPEGTGTTVLWSPLTDTDAPWFYYDCFHVGLEEGVTDIYEYAGVSVYRAPIESKAMRRIRNQEVQAVVETLTIGTAAAVNIAGCGRFLTQE